MLPRLTNRVNDVHSTCMNIRVEHTHREMKCSALNTARRQELEIKWEEEAAAQAYGKKRNSSNELLQIGQHTCHISEMVLL